MEFLKSNLNWVVTIGLGLALGVVFNYLLPDEYGDAFTWALIIVVVYEVGRRFKP